MRQTLLRRAWVWTQAGRVNTEDVGNGVTMIRMRSRGTRRLGLEVSAYLVGDLLIDTGFAYVREPLLETLAEREIATVCCTHSHEDHTGNCAAIARAHGSCVFLRHAGDLWDEGVRSLASYRRAWWGRVDPFTPEELPGVVTTGDRSLEVIPTPGHSRTQVAFFERATGDVFTGDLFVSAGATAVLVWGNPWLEAESLRRVAALGPGRMLTGHGGVIDDPASVLELKAERIEETARRALEMAADGASARETVRRVFPRGQLKDRFFEALTSREFSRLNFVKSAVKHAPSSGAASEPSREH